MATQDKLEFSIVLSAELNRDEQKQPPHVVAELASKIIRAATSLHRRYEAELSYEWAATDEYRAATERKERAIVKLVKPYGLECVFNGDPRGAPIKLKLPSGKTNDWGNEGYCVPTRSDWRKGLRS